MMRTLFLIVTLLLSSGVQAAEIRVAVAANFRDTLEVLADVYEEQTGNRLLISGGPTGALYNQVIHGAPFDLFFAADTVRPQKLVEAGFAQPDSVKVYALGQLVLWDPQGQLQTLQDLAQYQGRLAIASPQVAPYGAAAMEVLDHLELSKPLPFKMVRGNSIAHAYQYVHTGNAAVGFVAASQVINDQGVSVIPAELYTPLAQAMVPLGEPAPATQAFICWLDSAQAAEIIQGFGYGLPE